jgi:predicted dehydrogenase
MAANKIIKLAIIGAGIFATQKHVPALLSIPNLDIVAVWSKSEASAQKLAAAVPRCVICQAELNTL